MTELASEIYLRLDKQMNPKLSPDLGRGIRIGASILNDIIDNEVTHESGLTILEARKLSRDKAKEIAKTNACE